jgi:hypothetical protein
MDGYLRSPDNQIVYNAGSHIDTKIKKTVFTIQTGCWEFSTKHRDTET